MTSLIERLRETASKGGSAWGDLQMEAADTIEALFNRNRQLVVESSKYCAEVSRGMSDTIRLMAERDNLRAELNATEVVLEECKMDWSGDVTQIKAEHKHEVNTLRQQLAEALIAYRHKDGTTRFEQYAKDPVPAWAVDVQPVREPSCDTCKHCTISSQDSFEETCFICSHYYDSKYEVKT